MAEPESLPAQPWSDGNELLWDGITFNGKLSPGLATVQIKRENKWDKKKAKGAHGGNREYSGADEGTVKIKIRIVTKAAHEAFLANILPLIEPIPGKKKPEAVAIQHAASVARGVAQVTIDHVDGPNVENGIIIYDIDATEFREPDKKNATGKVVGGGGGGNCAKLRDEYYAKLKQIGSATSNSISASSAGNPQGARSWEDQAALFREQAAAIYSALQRCPSPPKSSPKVFTSSASAAFSTKTGKTVSLDP